MVFGERWQSWAGPDREHDLPTRLPRIAGERHGVQVLRALVELARGEEARGRPAPAAILAGAVERERNRLGIELDRICDRRVTDDERHLTWEAAADLLRRQVAELVVDNPPA